VVLHNHAGLLLVSDNTSSRMLRILTGGAGAGGDGKRWRWRRRRLSSTVLLLLLLLLRHD